MKLKWSCWNKSWNKNVGDDIMWEAMFLNVGDVQYDTIKETIDALYDRKKGMIGDTRKLILVSSNELNIITNIISYTAAQRIIKLKQL